MEEHAADLEVKRSDFVLYAPAATTTTAAPSADHPRPFCGARYQEGSLACSDYEQCIFDGRYCNANTVANTKVVQDLIVSKRRATTLEGQVRALQSELGDLKDQRLFVPAAAAHAEQARLRDALGNSKHEVAEMRSLLEDRRRRGRKSAEYMCAEQARMRDALEHSEKLNRNFRASMAVSYKDLDVLQAKYDKLLESQAALTASQPALPPRSSKRKRSSVDHYCPS